MRTSRSITTLILILAAFVSVQWSLSAAATEIVFDTFGPGDSCDTGFKYSSGQAFLFEPTQSGPLASISVALGRNTTSTTQTRFDLFENASLSFGALLVSALRGASLRGVDDSRWSEKLRQPSRVNPARQSTLKES